MREVSPTPFSHNQSSRQLLGNSQLSRAVNRTATYGILTRFPQTSSHYLLFKTSQIDITETDLYFAHLFLSLTSQKHFVESVVQNCSRKSAVSPSTQRRPLAFYLPERQDRMLPLKSICSAVRMGAQGSFFVPTHPNSYELYLPYAKGRRINCQSSRQLRSRLGRS